MMKRLMKEALTIRKVARIILFTALGWAAFFLFLPWLRTAAPASHCYSYFGINGNAWLLVGVTGFSALFALSAGAYLFLVCKRTVAHKQFPPPGRYLISPRKVHSGRIAVVQGYIGMVLAGLVVPAVAAYSVHGMVPLIAEAATLQTDTAECSVITAANKALPTASGDD